MNISETRAKRGYFMGQSKLKITPGIPVKFNCSVEKHEGKYATLIAVVATSPKEVTPLTNGIFSIGGGKEIEVKLSACNNIWGLMEDIKTALETKSRKRTNQVLATV